MGPAGIWCPGSCPATVLCQAAALKTEGAVQVGLAGPSGSGKTAFSQKIQTVLTGQADSSCLQSVQEQTATPTALW